MKIKWKCSVGAIIGLSIGVVICLYLAFLVFLGVGYVIFWFFNPKDLGLYGRADNALIFSIGLLFSALAGMYWVGAKGLYDMCKDKWH